jgi:hypothetical protein
MKTMIHWELSATDLKQNLENLVTLDPENLNPSKLWKSFEMRCRHDDTLLEFELCCQIKELERVQIERCWRSKE